MSLVANTAEKIETPLWFNMNDKNNIDVISEESNIIARYVPTKNVQRSNVYVEQKERAVDHLAVINEIISEDYKSLNVYEIIKRQSNVATHMSKLFTVTVYEDNMYDTYRTPLLWVLETSNFICAQTKNTNIKVFNTSSVHRSSYKFCDSKADCVKHYGKIIEPRYEHKHTCSDDHFVHNKLVSDITCLDAVFSAGNVESPCEKIRTSLHTIAFILVHMEQELGSFMHYSYEENFNINSYYVISKPRFQQASKYDKRKNKHEDDGRGRGGNSSQGYGRGQSRGGGGGRR
jgi:hypothetical protein